MTSMGRWLRTEGLYALVGITAAVAALNYITWMRLHYPAGWAAATDVAFISFLLVGQYRFVRSEAWRNRLVRAGRVVGATATATILYTGIRFGLGLEQLSEFLAYVALFTSSSFLGTWLYHAMDDESGNLVELPDQEPPRSVAEPWWRRAAWYLVLTITGLGWGLLIWRFLTGE